MRVLGAIADFLFGSIESEFERGKANAAAFMRGNPTSGEFMQYWGSAIDSFPCDSERSRAYDRGCVEVLRPHFVRYPELEGFEEL